MCRRTTRRLLQCWLTALLVLLVDKVVDGFLSSSSPSAPCQNIRYCPQFTKRVLCQTLHANRNKEQEIPILHSDNHDDSREDAKNLLSRRRAFQLSSSCVLAAMTVATTTHDPSMMALAATPEASSTTSTAAQVFLRLKNIPTFCIVDPNGVPFMIFDGQASAMGYFFLSFDIAAQALKDARQKDTNQGAGEVWEQAKIIVVPLAVALQVTLRKSQRPAVNADDIKFKTYGDIVPSQEGIDDAKVLDSSAGKLSSKWEQKGRVPLFYIEGMTLENGQTPRYFNRRDLLQEWTKQHPPPSGDGGVAVEPKIQVIDLVELFRTALPSLEALEKITLVPVAESNQVASRLLRESKEQGIDLPKYDFNKVYLVGKAQG